MGFDKFEWIRAVSADSRLAPVERLILTNIALFSVLHGEDAFRVRQQTVAERCATTKKSVGGALRKAKHHGYLVDGCPRVRGRGHFQADEHRLTMPEIGNHSTPFSEKKVTNETEIGNQQAQKKVTIGTEIGNHANASTSGNNTTKDIEKDIEKDGGEGCGFAARPPSCSSEENNKPPSRYCSRHQPNGTDDPCGACGEARRRYEAWQAAAAEQNETYERRFPEPLNHHDAIHPCSWAEWTASARIPMKTPGKILSEAPAWRRAMR
jgi:hypothetical protein